jgi:hypothetical protein
MEPKLWVATLLGMYIIYCFWLGLEGVFTEKAAPGYAKGGDPCHFSPSSWLQVLHPSPAGPSIPNSSGEIDLPVPPLHSLFLPNPITSAFFAKRTWLLGKRYGFVSPGGIIAYC